MASRRRVGAVAAVASLTLLAAACGSSGPSSSGSAGGARTVKVGILIDETGDNSGAWGGYQTAVKTAFDAINADGGVDGVKATYVIADSQSSTAATLSAAQDLIEQDHVSVLMVMDDEFYASEPYVLRQKVPVIGTGFDGPEWQVATNTNLFNADGNFDRYGIYPGIGQFVKDNGGTICGSIGASDAPAVTLQANQFIAECEAVGLKGTPVNSSLPFGSTDIGALALQLKSEHVNALLLPTLTTTAFPLLAQLKALGADIKLPILRTGYAESTLQSKATVAAAQGYIFDLTAAPVELQTPGAKAMAAALTAAGQPGPPSYGITTIWAEAQALKAGLEHLGKDAPTATNLITALRKVTNFNDGGLLSPLQINFTQYNTKTNCTWFVKLTGSAFVPFPGTPSCSTATKDLPSSTP